MESSHLTSLINFGFLLSKVSKTARDHRDHRDFKLFFLGKKRQWSTNSLIVFPPAGRYLRFRCSVLLL